MSPPALLLAARTKINAHPTSAGDRDEVRVAAATLLADLFAAGLPYGITPTDGAAVAALPTSSLDAYRARQVRRSRVTTGSPKNPISVESGPTRVR